MRETPLVSRRGRTRKVEQVFRWVRDHVVEGVARWVPPQQGPGPGSGEGTCQPPPLGQNRGGRGVKNAQALTTGRQDASLSSNSQGGP